MQLMKNKQITYQFLYGHYEGQETRQEETQPHKMYPPGINLNHK